MAQCPGSHLKFGRKTTRLPIVWYFRCAYWWTHPKDVKDGYGEGFGWDCWMCPESEPGLASLDAAKRAAERHASRHSEHINVRYEDGSFS